MEEWSDGRMERWNDGSMKGWKDGWADGKMERVEGRKDGKME